MIGIVLLTLFILFILGIGIIVGYKIKKGKSNLDSSWNDEEFESWHSPIE